MIVSCSTCCIPRREPETVEPFLSHLDTDHFELFLFNAWNKKEVSTIFNGYPFFSVHGSKHSCIILEEDPDKGKDLVIQDIDIAHRVGATTLVLHAYNSLNESLDLRRLVSLLNSLEYYAEGCSLTLSIELIPHIAIEIPYAASFLHRNLESPFFTIDLEYTSKYNCLDEVLTFSSRINNVHVRDYDGQWILDGKRRYLKPLDGTLDFPPIFSTISKSGYEGAYTLEAPHDTPEEINASLQWLRTSLRTRTSPQSSPGSSSHH
ncbi:MAG: sugar phosphate isomerase/epimerase [Theionarchaea archaeon]|nr:sugar phosphate isomerase/epimerase [Theionarchaea archaeon]